MCRREQTHMKVVNLLAILCETGPKEKAEEKCFLLLDEAKFGTAGHGCVKSLGREDVQF